MMAYLNLSSSADQDLAMMRATPAQVGIWFFLQCFCHRQCNGGKIINCRDWPAVSWQRLGIEPASVLAESPLWHFSGVDKNMLVVHGYNVDKEATFKRKQKMGKVFAERRWHKKQTPDKPVENGLPKGKPNGSTMGNPMREEGRKEGWATSKSHNFSQIDPP